MTEKMVATFGVCAIAVIVAAALAIRWVMTGEVSGEMITILGTLGGFLLGGRVNGAVTRVVNGTVKKKD